MQVYYQFGVKEKDIQIYLLKTFNDENKKILLKSDHKLDIVDTDIIYAFVQNDTLYANQDLVSNNYATSMTCEVGEAFRIVMSQKPINNSLR